MVYGHTIQIPIFHGVNGDYLSKYVFFASIYTCFYMQAFFILTGYTSNYAKDLKQYFLSMGKTVVLPWLSFSLIVNTLQSGGGNS